jgi:hypothetical protein
MRIPTTALLALFVLSCFVTPGAAKAPVPEEATPGKALGGNGFLNAAKTIAVLTTPENSCEAVEVATGKTLWKQTRTPVLLAVLGDRLFAVKQIEGKDNPVRVVGIELATGKVTFESAAFAFRAKENMGFGGLQPPPGGAEVSWSPVAVSGGVESYHFHVAPHWIAKEERLFLVWTGNHAKHGGAPRPPIFGGGALSVSLKNGEVTPGKADDKPPADATPTRTTPEAEVMAAGGITLKWAPKELPGGMGVFGGGTQSYLQAFREGKQLWERAYGIPQMRPLPIP